MLLNRVRCLYLLKKPEYLLNIKNNINLSSASVLYGSNKIELFINDQRVLAEPGMTILQACSLIDIEIPRYCFHERLSIAGNCRMCLVEVEKSIKPVASCAMPVMKGMRVKTDKRSTITQKAREGVTEFLLVNHPLDCPICDQAGECDLQDQTMAFGSDRSRFVDMMYSGKRAVEDKNIGPLIKTIMTRCIHCTKCIRFASEIAGVDDLGTTGRGSDMQVGTFVEKMFYSELSGNVIDLCPVGALTSKPYTFTARPWETRKTESIDVMDGVGSNIVISTRSGDVMRILPKVNDDINEEWISDKTRFAYDGLKYQRLVSPMIKKNDIFENCEWEKALNLLSEKICQTTGSKMMAVVGNMADAESMAALKEFFNRLGSHNVYTESLFPPIFKNNRASYIMNNGIASIEDADLIMIIGCNPRLEAPLVNARIRKAWLHNEADVAYLGDPVNLSYDYIHLGKSLKDFINLTSNKANISFRQKIAKSKKPMLILGYTMLKKTEGENILKLGLKFSHELQNNIKKDATVNYNWKVFNVLHTTANLVGALDLGIETRDCVKAFNEFVPELIYLVGTDDNTHLLRSIQQYKETGGQTFVVYQGHHGDRAASLADIILPGAAYTEKYGTYVNTEGRSQYTQQAVSVPGKAREDWKIIRALSQFVNEMKTVTTLRNNFKDISHDESLANTNFSSDFKPKYTLPYDDLLKARHLMNKIAHSQHLTNYGVLNAKFYDDNYNRLMSHVAMLNIEDIVKNLSKSSDYTLTPAMYTLKDFYMTDAISRASVTMAKCVKAASEAEGTRYFTQQETHALSI
ncbi:unnamed protein product [Gordionus sp. m RMFG-2023]|uniref:NADH-ubiquinone oxidoreductase 75 kDa subunit, mitochondrial-like isoform X2 n=1 Tax=Gordionus sp. m RMFG-2023 TaxID=3053472 RepID=UPI0030E25A3F